MFTCRIQDALTERRLNAEYYNPEYLKDDEYLANWKQRSLDSLRPKNAPIAYGVLKPDEIGDTYRVAKAEYFDGMFVNTEDCEPISSELFSEFARSESREGDILIAIGGYVGRPARVQKLPDKLFLNINRHLARFRPDDKAIDPYFALAYLSSSLGERQLTREITGSVQAGINLEDLRLVPVPLPIRLVQTYIGNKVQQAERLRERSRELEAGIKERFSFLSSDLQPKRKSWRVVATKVQSYRLNSSHYDSVILSMLDDAKHRVDLVSLGSLFGKNGISGGATPQGAEYPEKGIFFVRVQNVQPLRLNLSDAVYLSSKQDQELRRSRCDVGEIILTITGYPGVAAIVMEDDLPININQHSVRFDIREEWEAEYVVAALSTKFLQMQVNRLAIGGTRDALDYTSVSNLLIPVLPIEIRRIIVRDVIAANLATRATDRLITAAKLLVEALIEGNISELELQEAQEAIQQGDYTLDRQILSRLTRKGIPCRGDKTNEPPLFPNLDALYHVLSDDNDADDDSDWDSAPKSQQRWRSPIHLSRRAAEASTSYRAHDSAVTLLDEEVY